MHSQKVREKSHGAKTNGMEGGMARIEDITRK